MCPFQRDLPVILRIERNVYANLSEKTDYEGTRDRRKGSRQTKQEAAGDPNEPQKIKGDIYLKESDLNFNKI